MLTQALIREFKAQIGEGDVFADPSDLLTYSYDAAPLEPVTPALVVRPATSEALSRAVRLCNQNGLPLTVRGAGTNLSGGTVPSPGGVVIVTNGLNRILEINPEDMYAVVEPGVVTAKFAAAAQTQGLFYPPDPGSQAVSTLGGNVAENASGLRGLKYGVTRDYVMGLPFEEISGRIR
jgi:glycolate oxidase